MIIPWERFLQQRTRFFKVSDSGQPLVDREFAGSLNEEPTLDDYLNGKSTNESDEVPSIYGSAPREHDNRTYPDFKKSETFVVSVRKGDVRDGKSIDSFTAFRAWALKRYGR